MVNHLHFCNMASGWSAFYFYLSFNENISSVIAPNETIKCRLKLCVFSGMYKKNPEIAHPILNDSYL